VDAEGLKNGCISHMDLPHFDPVKMPEGIGWGVSVKDIRTYGHFDVYGWVLLYLNVLLQFHHFLKAHRCSGIIESIAMTREAW